MNARVVLQDVVIHSRTDRIGRGYLSKTIRNFGTIRRAPLGLPFSGIGVRNG
jgi:hypothetical protein